MCYNTRLLQLFEVDIIVEDVEYDDKRTMDVFEFRKILTRLCQMNLKAFDFENSPNIYTYNFKYMNFKCSKLKL